MASTFLGFSTTAASNTDVNGVSIQGDAPVSNFDNALREGWAILRRDLDGKVVYTAKSGNYTAVAADNNGVLRFTSAATLSLTAAATLGSGWHVTVYAYGGDVTVDPNSTELINGVSTFIIEQDASALIVCDGSAFYAISSSGNYRKDDGATPGPVADIFRDSASPAANDLIGVVNFTGRNSAAAKVDYGGVYAAIIDPTSTSEDGALDFYAKIAGSTVRVFRAGPNLDLTAGQIKFPATQVASSDVNTLDDYEEGSWTPTLTPNSGTITTSNASGSYTKIGNRVYFSVAITITTAGTGAGALFVSLPFTSSGLISGAGANQSSLVGASVVGLSASSQFAVARYDGTTIITSGTTWYVSGQYVA